MSATTKPDALAQFAHLRVHTDFSVSDGIITLDRAIDCALRDRMPALAITDLANLFGLVRFYKQARKKGVKPIAGSDVWLSNTAEPDKPFRVLLLCRDREGLRRLCELLSRAYLVNRRRGRAEIDPAWFSADDIGTDGLLLLTGGPDGDLGRALLAGNVTHAESLLSDWMCRFGAGNVYLEVQRAGRPDDDRLVALTVHLASDNGVPVVATHPVQFAARSDYKAHEARVCIAEGYVLADSRRPKRFTDQQYFKSQAEMAELFSDLPEALENSVEIARRCSLEITLGENFLPQFPTPPGMTLDDYMAEEARKGLAVRLTELYPDVGERERQRARYETRLQFEIDTIVQMGFPGYFLIVADFINWAKENGVPVGPGRGSGAGSLVAYSLRITDLDPLAYALLFERFLNPERVSMPDFDIDFCQDKRYRVIEYVRSRYGADAVSQIATFGTMASKAVVRDVGRVLDLPYGLCDRLSKLIPIEGAKPVSLAKAYELEPQIGDIMADANDGESVQELWQLAQALEGLTRGVGMHAGGVLIAPGKLTDYTPLYLADDADASPVSQFDKDDVEAVGLVKFDFLGLRNLTIIERALDYVKMVSGERPDLNALSFTDPAAYDILKTANTTAIFQVESEGMKKLLKKLGPDRFEDIIAVLALYRPGPLGSGMVDDFILRKRGQQEIDYFHPDLKASLEPTYGVIVYQEQVMQISQIIGGYTLGGADMLRRAMGKKKVEEMARHREIFRDGAKQKGYDEALAMQLFDLMEKFAEYGFNKSHTAAYAVVTYQTAWLKAHHCAAFMAATLSSDLDNTDTIKIFYEDTVANGIMVLPPDINASAYRFEPVDARTIRYGLGAVKGVGEPAVRALITAREHGPFVDLFDFCARVDRRVVNRRALEALIRAGAFDMLDAHRARLLASVGVAIESAEQAAANALQVGLFDDLPEEQEAAHPWVDVRAWTERDRLREEKTAIGFFISGHPFNAYRAEVRRFCRRELARLEPSRDVVRVAGVVMEVRNRLGARGKMAVVTLDDGSAAREVVVYAETLVHCTHKLSVDAVIIADVKVSNDEFSGGFRVVADGVLSLAEARSQHAQALELTLDDSQPVDAVVSQLSAHLAPYRDQEGACPIVVRCRLAGAEADIALGDAWQVRPDDNLLDALRDWLPEDAVRMRYPV